LLTGCNLDLPGKPDPAGRPVPADKELRFAALYGQHCAGCHGAKGNRGPAPPLNDPLFREIVPEAALEKTISDGRPGTSMPAFARRNSGQLSTEQIRVLVYGIKGKAYRGGDRQGEESPAVSAAVDARGLPAWDPVGQPPSSVPTYLLPEVKGDAGRGAKVFAQACATCHGDAGEGIELDGKRHRRINDRAFLALISDQALRRIIITGRPDLGMPNYVEKEERPEGFKPLGSGDVTDLVALLSSWRKGMNNTAANDTAAAAR
jgi:mono/diheme cytochrome c family protein